MGNGTNITLNRQVTLKGGPGSGPRKGQKQKRDAKKEQTRKENNDELEEGEGEVFEADDVMKEDNPGTKYFVPYAAGSKIGEFSNKKEAEAFAKKVRAGTL